MSIFDPRTWFKGKAKPPRPKADPDQTMYWAMRDAQARTRQLEESFLDAAPYDLISPFAQFYDGTRLLFPILPNRLDFRQSPGGLWLTEGQFDLVRTYARWLYRSNPYAQAGLRAMGNYVVAKGFKYNVSARRHATAPKAMLKQANKFLEDFLNKNKWWLLEREMYDAKRRDGDIGLRLFPQDDGVTRARTVTGEFIRNNSGPQEWLFGVLTDPDDRSERLAYKVWYSPEEHDIVPADEMFLLTNDVASDSKRGISDFFSIHEILDDTLKLLRAGRQGEAVRQAMAYIRQWVGTPPGAIQAMIQADEDQQDPRITTQGSKTESVHRPAPGEVIDIPESMEMRPGPVGNADNAQKMLDSSLKAAAVKWNIAPWILTGDVSANFASALVSESPMTKQMEYDQFVHKQEYVAILTRVLEVGVQQGILPQDTLEHCEITAEGAPIAARNLLQETQINSILSQNKLLSKRTWSAREDLDHDAEQDQIREEGEQPTVTNPLKTPSPTPGAAYEREVNR